MTRSFLITNRLISGPSVCLVKERLARYSSLSIFIEKSEVRFGQNPTIGPSKPDIESDLRIVRMPPPRDDHFNEEKLNKMEMELLKLRKIVKNQNEAMRLMNQTTSSTDKKMQCALRCLAELLQDLLDKKNQTGIYAERADKSTNI